jgi:fructokinase
MGPLYGGVEAGGTRFVCAVGTAPDDLRAKIQFPTTTPAETLGSVSGFFWEWCRKKALAAIGIASFGPLDLNPSSPTYGYITSTPKPGWAHVNIVGAVQSALDIPVAFDTDVNGAALGEHTWGAARGLNSFLYLTIGTGIGGGGMMNGKLMHGLSHPEMGHISIPHNLNNDAFAGCCPFHGDCLEGLASGQAMALRWGKAAELLPSEHPAWELEAEYLSLAVANYIFTLSPELIIMGGGIMRHAGLLESVQKNVQRRLNGYPSGVELTDRIETLIVRPGLGELSGVFGAIALAKREMAK